MQTMEFTPMRFPKRIWDVHHNNNGLRARQGTPIKVHFIDNEVSQATASAMRSIELSGPEYRLHCPHPAFVTGRNECAACGKRFYA